MPRQHFEFETVDQLLAQAIGVPGKRTFFIQGGRRGTYVRLWLEKEQLQMLALAIEQLLASQEPSGTATRATEPLEPDAEQPLADEYKVGRLGLGYDERRDLVVLFAYEEEAEERASPSATLCATRGQAQAFSKQAAEVCAAGRPLCPLCGGPIDPDGHVCPKANGHFATQA